MRVDSSRSSAEERRCERADVRANWRRRRTPWAGLDLPRGAPRPAPGRSPSIRSVMGSGGRLPGNLERFTAAVTLELLAAFDSLDELRIVDAAPGTLPRQRGIHQMPVGALVGGCVRLTHAP